MFTINRYFKNPLQRSAKLLLHENHRVLTTPLIQQVIQYSNSKDSDNADEGKFSKKPRTDNKKISVETDRLDEVKGDGQKGIEKKAMKKENKGPSGPPKIDLRILPASYSNMGYEERNMNLGRELSPHLRIYKIQLTSVMSIFLRMSGFVLALGIWIIGVSGLCCDFSIEALAKKIEDCDCSRTIFNILKFFIVLPFAYHMIAGTRHLIWYLNVFLTMPQVYATGYVAIALTFLVAGCLTIIKPEDKNETKTSKVDYSGQIEMNTENLVAENIERYDEVDPYEDEEQLEKNIEH